MPDRGHGRVYSDEETIKKLKNDLPDWELGNGCIRRVYKTHSWKGTLMVVNTVGHLAEVAWHHPDLIVSYKTVEVRLVDHAAKGISDKDFELAAKLDEVILWRPEKDNGALTGTPENPRFAYIDHDG